MQTTVPVLTGGELRSEDSDWSELETWLTTALAGLADHGFLTLAVGAAKVGDPPPARRRIFGLGKRPLLDGGAFTQVSRSGEWLHVECVGSTSFGGRHAWTQEQEDSLTQLGWEYIRQPIGEAIYVPVPEMQPDQLDYGRPQELAVVARLMVATMRDVAGVARPSHLRITTG